MVKGLGSSPVDTVKNLIKLAQFTILPEVTTPKEPEHLFSNRFPHAWGFSLETGFGTSNGPRSDTPKAATAIHVPGNFMMI